MLVKLEFVESKVEAWNTRLDECIEDLDKQKEYRAYEKEKNIYESWKVKDNKCRILQDLSNEGYPVGFYGLHSARDVEALTNYKVVNEFYSFSPEVSSSQTFKENLEKMENFIKKNKKIRNNYGTCDDKPKQILKFYPELKKSKTRKFVVGLQLLTKKNDGGFRWHKNGKYIGKHKINHECFADENFDEVVIYHIYEVEEIGGINEL